MAYRTGGEPVPAARGQAGAHFDLIEENVAVGLPAAVIHDEWIDLTRHRSTCSIPRSTALAWPWCKAAACFMR